MNCSSFRASALNWRMPSAVFSVAIALSLNSKLEKIPLDEKKFRWLHHLYPIGLCSI